MENLEIGRDSSLDSGIEKENHAVLVIKPDAFSHKDEIFEKLENAGLHIISSVDVNLPEDFVSNVMYRNLPEGIKEETVNHFKMGESIIVLVEGGENMLEDIIKVTGEKTNPVECDPESIRYLFGKHFGVYVDNAGKMYNINAIHRGKNQEEIEEDLKKFKVFLI